MKLVEIGAASREELEVANTKYREAASVIANLRQKLLLLGLSSQRVASLTSPYEFALRAVRLGPESNGFYPVPEGLNAGERIVTEGSFLLRAEWLKTKSAASH